MGYGYSVNLLEANKEADGKHLGVRLGRKCIAHRIPVSKVAKDLGVSRPTVYNWFCGATAPQGQYVDLIRAYIAQLQR